MAQTHRAQSMVRILIAVNKIRFEFRRKINFLISLLYGDWTVGFIKKGGREGHLGGSEG